MFLFGACGKCQGDLYFDRDSEGTYISCLQCGYRRYLGLRTMPQQSLLMIPINQLLATALQEGLAPGAKT